MAAASPEAEASITIHRTSPQDVQQRQIIVKLNGENVGELLFGDTISFPVNAGRHRLRVDNTWNWKTLELDISAGDHFKFQTINRAGRLTWFLVSMFGAGPIHVSIEREK